MRILLLLAVACSTLAAQDIAGKWTGFADTVDASGVKRRMQQTIEIRSAGRDLTAQQISSQGTGIPLKLVADDTGLRFTLMRELDFEGGEHIRWHLELKDGRLTGSIQCVHDSPKKWGVDWGGPIELTRAN